MIKYTNLSFGKNIFPCRKKADIVCHGRYNYSNKMYSFSSVLRCGHLVIWVEDHKDKTVYCWSYQVTKLNSYATPFVS